MQTVTVLAKDILIVLKLHSVYLRQSLSWGLSERLSHARGRMSAKVIVLQITAKDRAQLFWAAAVLDVASPAALERLAELLSTVQPADVDRDFHAKLFQAHMALERLAAAAAGTESGDKEPMARPPLRLLSGEMLAQAEAAWRCVLADVSSQTQACTTDSFGEPCFQDMWSAIVHGCTDACNYTVMRCLQCLETCCCSDAHNHNRAPGYSLRAVVL